MSSPEIIRLTRSQIVERTIMWENKPLSLKNYPMFVAPYDGVYKKTLLKCSRQVGKSIKLMADLITDSIGNDFYKSLFSTPSEEQTNKFSTLRVGKAIKYSPLIMDRFIDPSQPNRTLTRAFTNGSEIVFTYACEDGDRVRGNHADHVMLDEVQDTQLEAVYPEIREVLSNSEIRRESFCGTPKTMENGIELLWSKSSQTEWAMPCQGCGKYSIIVSEKQLGKYGPICGHCGKHLNPRLGVWVDTNTNAEVEYKGFHINRPIMLRCVQEAWSDEERREKARKEWTEDVLGKLYGSMPYPLPKFRNEVLGVSDSMGLRLVTEEMLWEAAVGPPMADVPTPALMKDVVRRSAGIDWSGGGKDGKSFTVLIILGRLSTGKMRVLFFKIFPGIHAVEENKEIIRIIKNYDVGQACLVGGDAGEGNMNMDMLRTVLTPQQRVVKFRYVGPNAKHYVLWDKQRVSYQLNRTVAIDSLMMALVRREIEFPREPTALLKTAFAHILAEYEETTSRDAGARKLWRHSNIDPDDFLHALVFARTSLQIASGELNLGSKSPDDPDE